MTSKRPTPLNRLGKRARFSKGYPDDYIPFHPHRGSRRNPFFCRTCGDPLKVILVSEHKHVH